MIALLLRSLWIVTICCAAIAASLSVRYFGARIGPWAAALAGVFAVGALHPAAIAFNFVASRVFGDPVPPAFRLAPWRALLAFDAEIDASMRGLWFATPFLAHRPAPRPAAVLHDLPILFVHGYFCNRAVWSSFMRDAAARGWLVEAVTLRDPFASIDTQVADVDRAIDALLETARGIGSPATRVAIVAHSMGGLVARALCVARVDPRVAHVITLGTPHRGTHTARFGRAASVVQMRRASPWLVALAARETDISARTMTTVWSHHDEVVYPQTTGALDGATQVAIGGCGHVALLYDRRVRAIVFDRLDELELLDRRAQAASGLAW